jgi:hypothetical protein
MYNTSDDTLDLSNNNTYPPLSLRVRSSLLQIMPTRCYRCRTIVNRFKDRFLIISPDGIIKGLCNNCVEQMITKKETLETCLACNKQCQKLLNHHWYEPPEYKYHSMGICTFCNTVLTAKNLWRIPKAYHRGQHPWLNHILPSWDLQVSFIENRQEYRKIIYQHYTWPLPMPRIVKTKGDAESALYKGELTAKSSEGNIPELWF